MEAKTFTKKESGLYERKTFNLKAGEFITIDNEEDNLHEFSTKEEECTFLDVIFPDYGYEGRKCTTYEVDE